MTEFLFCQSADKEFQYRLQGRMQLDAGLYRDVRNQLTSDAGLRRGRLGVTGRLWHAWRVEFEIEHDDNELKVQDVWLSYDQIPSVLVKVGHFKEPFSLEYLSSSLDTTFLERALPSPLALGRNLGVGYSQWGKDWRLTAGLFGRRLGELLMDDDGSIAGNGVATTTRLTVSPINRTGQTVHLGVSASYRTRVGESSRLHVVQLRSRSDIHYGRAGFPDREQLLDANHVSLWGTEVAVIMGSALIQGEYIRANIGQLPFSSMPSASFVGAYVQTAWVLTGARRLYSHTAREDGELGRVSSSHPKGTWELAARYSWLDLNTRTTSGAGGQADNVTVGLNWYVNLYIRVMVNYMIADDDVRVGEPNGHAPNIFQVRVQASF